jgi:hypothetical protein
MIVKTLVKITDYTPMIKISKDKWRVYFDKKDNDDGVTCLCQVFDLIGSSKELLIEKIKESITDFYNKQTDKAILSGFVWIDSAKKEHNVWLSSENQFNYKAAYDAYVANGMPTNGFIVKFGDNYNNDYYTFTDITTLADFYLKGLKYVQDTLSVGWTTKNAIDWSVYENLLQ